MSRREPERITVELRAEDETARAAMRQIITGVSMLDAHIAHLEYVTDMQDERLRPETG
jgi:hypothetical protein